MLNKFLPIVVLVSVAFAAEDDFYWHDHVERYVNTAQKKVFEGKVKDLDDCRDTLADSVGGEALQYHKGTQICIIYPSHVPHVEAADKDYSVHYRFEKEDDEGITTAGIIVTVILSIIYGLCLILLAFNCKSEHVDISDQMERLEKKELEKEDAASEDWERKSQHEEEMAEKEAAKAQA